MLDVATRILRDTMCNRCLSTLLLALLLILGSVSMVLADTNNPLAGTERLVGRWVRPDGGYVLELRDFTADGQFNASYSNQRPVQVAQARWRASAEGFDLFIELRDVNYPGSTYRLHYDSPSDRMLGLYFQAMYKQNYRVEFVRGR